MLKIKRTLGLTILMVNCLAGEAFAHAQLVTAAPAEKSTVATSPTELDLKFSESVNLKFTRVKVKGPDEKDVRTGAATLGEGDDSKLIVPLPGALAAGPYTVEWSALSTDGHKSHGSYTFTVKP
jgi:methionine-rich copper-binding protein CopC